MPYIIEVKYQASFIKHIGPVDDILCYVCGTTSYRPVDKPVKKYKLSIGKSLAKKYTRRSVAQKVVDKHFAKTGRVVPV